MKKRTFHSVAGLLLAGLLAGELAAAEVVKFNRRDLAGQWPGLVSAGYADVFKSITRTAVGNASTTTGEVAIAAVGFQGEAGSAKIGLRSPRLMNTGSVPWDNVTVSATIQVLAISESASLCTLWVHLEHENQGYSSPVSGYIQVSAPGTYTVTSNRFSMVPNREYWGLGAVSFGSTGTNGAWVRAKVLSVKFNF